MSVRKAHNAGRNHLRNVVEYYQRMSHEGRPLQQAQLTTASEIGQEKAQSVIDSITSSYAAEGQPVPNPAMVPPGAFPPPFGFPGRPGQIPPPPFGIPPPGAPGAPGMPPPPGARGLPFPPPFPTNASGTPPTGGFPPPLPNMPPGAANLPPPPIGGFPANFPIPPPGAAGAFPPPMPPMPGASNSPIPTGPRGAEGYPPPPGGGPPPRHGREMVKPSRLLPGKTDDQTFFAVFFTFWLFIYSFLNVFPTPALPLFLLSSFDPSACV
ncbi:uncharacterized protein N7459_009399 [Penicillium hispanicum]|uniref:uncharacterized protein n=1 Tax=Penicillium hispanicum TaxID=1080232 RepID=UPI00253FC09E|nr:uncharacterized protein N7459_009399 [Penicillium hispanicum]KAJ5569969.1 hypothetical protein N7459_009399 [Penicillium hispanicum]